MKNNYQSFKENKGSLWKSLFAIMALILSCQNISAQAVVTMPPANTGVGSLSYPLNSNYGYMRTGAIYTSAELGMTAGTVITSICYYVNAVEFPNPAGAPVKVYMTPTAATGFSSSSYAGEIAGASLVYSGTIPGSSYVAGAWVCIPLTAPYTYTGQNLKVLVQTDAGGSGNEHFDAKYFRWSNGAFGVAQQWAQNLTPPTSGSTYNTRPNAQLYHTVPTAAGTLFFNSSLVTASENTTAVFTVNRVGGSTGTVSVNYATSDGTANAGSDYTASSGTLTWASGDTAPKTINVAVAADFAQDNGETMTVTLSNPVGTALVGNNVATLTITDVLPPMKGVYTVGTGGDYASLTNAGGLFQAINNRIAGVSGALTVNIISDITNETGINALNEIPGGYPVLIQPSGSARTISGIAPSGQGMLRFTGTDNVTINGSTTGANASSCAIGGDAAFRQLTIQCTSISVDAVTIYFQSGTGGSKNNTIKNVNIIGGSSNGAGWGVIFGGNTLVGVGSLGTDNDGNRVENCSVKRCLTAIYSAGQSTANPNIGTVITQNDVSATGTDRVSRNAVRMLNETFPIVTYNKVDITNTGNVDVVGLAIGASRVYATDVTSGGISDAMVSNNLVKVVSTETVGFSAGGIVISGTASGGPNVVQNNMITNVQAQAKGTYLVAGIYVVGAVASVTKVYHNTISLSGDRGTETAQMPSYCIALSGLDPSLDMRNNIMSTTQIVTGGGLVKTYAFGTLSTTFANLNSDYNVFYSGGVQDGGFRSGSLATNAGISYAALADWQTAVSDDAHSIEVTPVFESATDLHLTAGSNPAIAAAGTPIGTVSTDIDCEPRSATNPTIGADEISGSGFTIAAGAGSNGTITPAGSTSVTAGASQAYAITPNCGYAISDVLVDGVSQGAIAAYTFNNVTANHTITATFTGQTATITAGGPTTFCQGGSVLLTSSSMTGNTWSTGETTQSILAQASGNYTVSVNNGSCTSPMSAPVLVTVMAPPAAPTVTVTGNGTQFCDGGSATLTSSAATGNLWSTGETTQSIVVTTQGAYSVSYNNGICTSPVTTAHPITVFPRPVAVITPSGPTTFCQGGSVTLTSSAANGNTWSNGATTQSITVSVSGTYTVVVSGGCNSLPSNAITTTMIARPARPTVTVTGATTFCEGGSVVLTSSATDGNLWSNGETTQAITVTTAGIYNVTVTVDGCTSLASTNRTVTVTAAPATPTITAGGPTTFCPGGSVTLTSSSATGNVWSTGATTQSITVSASGTYTVAVTVGSCTSAASAGTTVTVNSLPTTPTISAGSATTFCVGDSVVLTSSSATGNVWSNGETTQSITVSASGTYTVAVTNSGCTSATSAGTTVTVNALPATPTISAGSVTTFCAGGSVVLTSSAASGNLWSTGATTQSITVSASGTYTVAVTVGSCTSATSAGTVITVTPNPTLIVTNPAAVCAPITVDITLPAVTAGSTTGTLTYYTDAATTLSLINPAAIAIAGTYYIKNTVGSCSAIQPVVVTIISLSAAPTISASGATTFCAGDSVILTSSAASGNMWSNGATTQSITVSAPGTYTVVVNNGSCTSATSAGTTVVVNAVPATPTISAATATTFCAGGSVVLTSSSATGNVWSTGATTQSITVSTPGTYTVSVDNGNCTSAASAGTTITVNAVPSTPTISAAGATTFCAGDSVVLTSSSATGNLWSTGATTQSITVSTPGTYTVLVDNGNCTSVASAGTTVTVNALPATPTITAAGATTFCAGDSVVLTSSSATGNLWSTGATTQSITVSASGTYTVSVNNGSCTSAVSAATTVTANPMPLAGVTQALGIVTAAQTGASYQWYDCSGAILIGEIGQTFTPTVVGDYKVEVTLGNCMVTSACINVIPLGNEGFELVNKFKLYPNPVTEILNIEYNKPLSSVTLFDMLGQKVSTQNTNANAAQLDMARLSAGVYFVEVRSGAVSKIFKVIKR
jgi:hypothetical protein